MPKIYICFLWHMHQPFYKDLASGEYKLPWTRLHALKDYRGMVRVLEEFPRIRQTFNLVPSLLVQVEEYASGRASDPFLRCALKPAEELTGEEQQFILRYFFQANPERMIYRYPRYGELFDAWRAADCEAGRASRMMGVQAMRDLQVLSQLCWFDEDVQTGDPEVRELIAKERGYTLADQQRAGAKQAELLAAVKPAYQEAASRGQIEISTTPFYHPILPLICDSSIAEVANPQAPLPSRFRYPQDARLQLERARLYIEERFTAALRGLWPSEGAVSDEALGIAAGAGFRWAATDNGVLARTLGREAGVAETYRPYLVEQNGRSLHLIFRDHFLSDLIGFVYSRMGAAEAAADFVGRIRGNCAPLLAAGHDALVPVILDGENAWEYYESNGRPFLRALYRQISEDPHMEALTVSEALERMRPEPLRHIFPGSWINANFDVWIGSEEDNQAWERLLRARETFERVTAAAPAHAADESGRDLALEELLIAEGSDWCWWYGPEHSSENRPEFDTLFRDHLANVYRALGLAPPDELSRPIVGAPVQEFHTPPTAVIAPAIDGEVTSFFEWLGAGVYRVDGRSGAMHGRSRIVRELRYGTDGANLYLRLDFEPEAGRFLANLEIRVRIDDSTVAVRLLSGVAEVAAGAGPSAEAAYRKVFELRVPLPQAGAPGKCRWRVQVSLWQENLPLDALPARGALEVCAGDAPHEAAW